ncbi:low molecular weight phosphotyrosine protein phosphatase [Clostridium sp. SYSU_GA19001]|uniref:low molecular weight protein-tyrosine-phosphatase n=1 Tax=Clostridium caldaquaticum TaxID=2940653 RepID=UPI00207799CA|nr:low molecular weight protein-tyrosine-phosphatase [Clostridium caldaquaticum]MCM8709670.1 low molecular weight phosphotyrosine protein phosphatase [Clostridium caldaquaticum]
MIKIMFVCHGNICRSPMAEFVFRHMVKEKHLLDKFYIASSATSREEIGNSVHYGTKRKLKEVGISCDGKTAVQLTKKDYEIFDYIICMESYNLKNALRIVGEDKEKKIFRLLDFSTRPRDIADPWYTGNFDETYNDILEGCEALLNYILKKQMIE